LVCIASLVRPTLLLPVVAVPLNLPLPLPPSASPPRMHRPCVRRMPARDADGTGTWSLTTLQRALRQAPDGLPRVSTATIGNVLHDAGLRWQRDRSWCETGVVVRQRKSGAVTVSDADAGAKKN